MKSKIPFRQRQKALFGLILITALTYMVMVVNILYGLEIDRKYIAAPGICYMLFCLIVIIYFRILNWWEMLTMWFDRKSEDERSDD